MIIEWEDAFVSHGSIVLTKGGTGEEYQGMRNDLIVYRSSVPIPIGGEQIDYFVLEEYQEGYRCLAAYNEGDYWWGADDDRLGGEDRSPSELARATPGTEEEVVQEAEARLNNVFTNG